ncbi:unnamed protein product, partial [Closterium sp. Naga37s-1]
GLGAKLDSKDWFVVCEGLIELRRVAKFNSERLNERLESYYDSMLKSLKNPRSVLRKTLWMTFEDLFSFNTTCMEGSLESLMQPLLIQASQDNKFMVEAVDRALSTMTSTLNPEVTFKAVQPCIAHKSPRVRSKAMIYAYQAAVRLNTDQVKVIGLDVLLKIAATQMKDQAPEGREAARKLAVTGVCGAWRVTVRIQQCDMRRGYLCGSMEALNVPSTDTSVVTFWDGEIVDGKNYSFFTGQWDATRETDIKHWSRFPCFSQLKEAALKDGARSIDLSTFPYIFMRWKEKFFVNVGPDSSLSSFSFLFFLLSSHHIALAPPLQPISKAGAPATAAELLWVHIRHIGSLLICTERFLRRL